MLLLFGFGVLTAGIFTLAKTGADAGIPPLALVFWQAFIGGLVIFVLALREGRLPRPTPHYWRYFVLSGLTGIALPNAVAFVAIRHVGPGLIAILFTLPPILTYLLATLAGLEKPRWRRGLGILVGFIGALMIVLPRNSLPSPDLVGWMLLALLLPFSLACGNVYRTWDWPPGGTILPLGAGMLVGAAALILPLMFLFDQFYVPGAAAGDWVVLGQGLMTALAYVLFFELQRKTGPVYLSQVGYIITPTGVALSVLFYNEAFSAWIWGAIIVLFLGLALVNGLPGKKAIKP